MLTIGSDNATRVRDPHVLRQLSVDALCALVADTASVLAMLQAVLTAKLLEANPAATAPIPTHQADEDQLLTLAQARKLLQVRKLPAELPQLRLSPKRVRVRRSDIRPYIQQCRAPAPQRLAPDLFNPYSAPYDGKRAAADTQRARADAIPARGSHRSDVELARSLGAGRDRHLRAGRPVGARAGAATSPPSKGEVNGSDEES